MTTGSAFVRIRLSAESATAYAEMPKAVVVATREEAGWQWYGSASDLIDPRLFGFVSNGPLNRTLMHT